MAKFEAFQKSREQYLESSQDMRGDAFDLKKLEGENQQLEEENKSLQLEAEEKEGHILKSPEGIRILNSYLLTTPFGVLYEAIKTIHKETGDQKSLLETVAKIERSRLKSDYDVEIVEPGEIASDMVRSISSILKHEVYMSDPEAKIVIDEAIQKLEHLGKMSPSDIRTTSQIFKLIPPEHLSASVKTIEKTPVREALSILQGLSKKLGKITDKEMVDRVAALQRALQETRGGTAAYIRPRDQQVVFSEKVSSLFAWILAHEVGHGVYDNILEPKQVDAWEDISKRALTMYGEHVGVEHQANENFAETYALFLLNKPLFKILGIFDEDFQKQYEYFKNIMPEGTSNLPKVAGISYPLMDKGSRWLLGAVEKITKFPLYETAKQSLKYTYDKRRRTEAEAQLVASRDELFKNFLSKLQEVFFGETNPEFVQHQEDVFTYGKRLKEFMKKDVTELHQSRKIFRLLTENDLLQEAYEESQSKHINGKSLRQLTGSSTLMSAYTLASLEEGDEEFVENARIATAVFLEDRVTIVSNIGQRSFKYKKEYQEKIDNLLIKHNLEKVVPLTYEVQMDGLRALKQPSEDDVREAQRLKDKYGVEFKNSEERGFSAVALKSLEEAMAVLPQDDLRLLAGFMRLSENTSGNILKTFFKNAQRGNKSWVPVNDLLLALSTNEIQNFIAAHVSQEVLRSNNELAQEFKKIGGWHEVKPPLHTRALAKFFSGSNPYVHFRLNDLEPEAFLNQSSRVHMQSDFQTCYQWFLLYNEEFEGLATTNATLRAKYELFEKYFDKKTERSSE